MQLEALCIQLGITQHIHALSEFRDALLRDNAAALQALSAEKDMEKAAALSAVVAPPAPIDDGILSIDADLVLSRRLTAAEKEALFTARRTVWQVDYFLTRASTTGIVSTADADLPAAQAMFAELGIIAANRWTDLLAP
jgi:hypothetical protein